MLPTISNEQNEIIQGLKNNNNVVVDSVKIVYNIMLPTIVC